MIFTLLLTTILTFAAEKQQSAHFTAMTLESNQLILSVQNSANEHSLVFYDTAKNKVTIKHDLKALDTESVIWLKLLASKNLLVLLQDLSQPESSAKIAVLNLATNHFEHTQDLHCSSFDSLELQAGKFILDCERIDTAGNSKNEKITYNMPNYLKNVKPSKYVIPEKQFASDKKQIRFHGVFPAWSEVEIQGSSKKLKASEL